MNKISKICEQCEEDPCTVNCPTCGQYLCENCDQKIHNKGNRKLHQRVSLSDLQQPKNAEEKIKSEDSS